MSIEKALEKALSNECSALRQQNAELKEANQKLAYRVRELERDVAISKRVKRTRKAAHR
jgi:cell division protein FtsB